MPPHLAMRLDIAIDMQERISDLYNNYIVMQRNVTFADIMESYLALEKIEARAGVRSNA